MTKCNRSRLYIQGHAPSHDFERVAEYSELLMKEIDVYRCMDCGVINVPNVWSMEKGEIAIIKSEFDIGPPDYPPETIEGLPDLSNINWKNGGVEKK